MFILCIEVGIIKYLAHNNFLFHIGCKFNTLTIVVVIAILSDIFYITYCIHNFHYSTRHFWISLCIFFNVSNWVLFITNLIDSFELKLTKLYLIIPLKSCEIIATKPGLKT